MNARFAIISVAILLASSRTSALNPALDITQYAHTAWRIGEGVLNSRVVSIAQTPDGYLWLGTESAVPDRRRASRARPARNTERYPARTSPGCSYAGRAALARHRR